MAFARPKLEATTPSAPSVPRQMLLGFVRVKTLPGQTTSAELRVPAKRLRLVGADGKYELQRGDYELFVGGRAPGSASGLPANLQSATAPLRRMLRIGL